MNATATASTTKTDEAKNALAAVYQAAAAAPDQINKFCRRVFRTRGGRMGTGMGTLLEGLWLYAINRELQLNHGDRWELAWLPDHEYNDFALLTRGCSWDRSCRDGELLRIEAKSMVVGADESKAHFDEIVHAIGPLDQVLVLVWKWEEVKDRIQPVILETFLGQARSIAGLRDELHVARGGTFVDQASCPDTCTKGTCRHHGEPLNADGKRERLTGPETRRVSAKTSFAANFGGMVRMLKASDTAARVGLRRVCQSNQVARSYVEFIWRHFPDEQFNHFSIAEWREFAKKNGIDHKGLSKPDLAATVCSAIRESGREMLTHFAPKSVLSKNGN